MLILIQAVWNKAVALCTPKEWAKYIRHTEIVIETWMKQQLVISTEVLELITEVGNGDTSDNFEFSDNNDTCKTGNICASCDKIYHSYCLNRYCSNEEVCPNCKNDWLERETFRNSQDSQEDAPMEFQSDDSDPNQPGPSQRHQRHRPSKHNQMTQNDSDSDSEISTSAPSKRRVRRS